MRRNGRVDDSRGAILSPLVRFLPSGQLNPRDQILTQEMYGLMTALTRHNHALCPNLSFTLQVL